MAKYFVPPPFFDAVVGDAGTPNASIVLAPRGGGKTALRRMVEEAARDHRFLAVTYDRFEFSSGEKISNITLQYHLRNIITRILVSYLSYLAEYPDLLKNLSKNEKQQLSLFASSYLGSMRGDSLQELLKELRSLPERFRDFWQKNVGIFEPVINFLLKNYGLEAIDFPDVRQEEKRLSETYKYQMESLLNLVNKLGFRSIYVLIDKPDETEQTGNDPQATYRLIQPMVRDLELLGLKGYGFKFFLWDKVEEYHRDDARPDRVPQYQLNWKRMALQKVLTLRLQFFSGGSISSFRELVAEDPGFDIDVTLGLMAYGSPRNLIRICERVFAVQAENNSDASNIDVNSLDQGVLNYCEQYSLQTYSEDTLREVQRVGRELFTVNYAANDVFKISQNAARTKITGWNKLGLTRQIGTITVDTSKRPLNFYCIVDPAVVRLIHRTSSLSDFIKARWLPCSYCQTDNLMDIGLFPDENIPTCRECGRNLI